MKEPRIVEIVEKKLVGKSIIISITDDKTGTLWQSFMPHRNKISHRTGSEYFSVQVYDGALNPVTFTKDTRFEKWAAVEVTKFEDLPENMKKLTIPAGKYAVFVHHGLASEFNKSMEYIYTRWLPASEYQLDDRPHFEIMGDKYYGPTDANSEEEIWIPVK